MSKTFAIFAGTATALVILLTACSEVPLAKERAEALCSNHKGLHSIRSNEMNSDYHIYCKDGLYIGIGRDALVKVLIP